MYTKENTELIELLKPELFNHILDAKESFEMHSRQNPKSYRSRTFFQLELVQKQLS